MKSSTVLNLSRQEGNFHHINKSELERLKFLHKCRLLDTHCRFNAIVIWLFFNNLLFNSDDVFFIRKSIVSCLELHTILRWGFWYFLVINHNVSQNCSLISCWNKLSSWTSFFLQINNFIFSFEKRDRGLTNISFRHITS